MPDFETTVSFEAFCSECGNGICNNFKNKSVRGNSFWVDLCDTCIKEKDSEIKALEEKIEDLEELIENLRKELNNE